MKKSFAVILMSACLLLTGCRGTTVIYQEMTPPVQEVQPDPVPETDNTGALKTGLAILADTTDSDSAEDASYDVAVAAVTVDDSGVIRGCVIDGYNIEVPFDTTGTVTGNITQPVQSLREGNGEWTRVAESLARDAVGKTTAQLRSRGDSDDELLSVVVQAAESARHMGAQEGDELRLALTGDLSDSTSATDSEAGRVRLSCDAAAVTLSGEVITSCRIDSVQADVNFDAMGTITGELSRHVKTKTELGDDYGMKRYGGAKYEWYEQVAHFTDYITGKTGQEVLDLVVTDGKPTQPELAASVTISVTPFQRLIAAACGLA